MSSGTGVGVLDEVINLGTNYLTLGTTGYGKQGFGIGNEDSLLGRGIDGLKEVTGANAAEDANELAREQAEIDRNQKLAAREQAISEQERTQVARSRKSGQSNVSTSTTSASGATTFANNTDFLGL